MFGAIAGDCIELNAISCGLLARKLSAADELDATFLSWVGGVTGTSLISTPLFVVAQMLSFLTRFLSFLSIKFDCRFCGAFGSKILLVDDVISSVCVDEEWLNGDPGSDESLVACESRLIVMTPLRWRREMWFLGWMCWKRHDEEEKEEEKKSFKVTLVYQKRSERDILTYETKTLEKKSKMSRQIRRVLLNY